VPTRQPADVANEVSMKLISSHVRAAAIATLIATPALADGPAYVGTWASAPAQCRVGQEEENAPMIMRRDGYDQHEAHCKFTAIARKGSDWTVKARCTVEGNNVNLNLMLAIAGDRLTIRDERGPSTYQRCR
jgi:hypothetical protein